MDDEAYWLQFEEEEAAAAMALAREENEASRNLKRTCHEQVNFFFRFEVLYLMSTCIVISE